MYDTEFNPLELMSFILSFSITDFLRATISFTTLYHLWLFVCLFYVFHILLAARIENCISLCYSLLGAVISRLQYVQNSWAHILAFIVKRHRTIFEDLWWLSVSIRVICKILILFVESFNELEYLSSFEFMTEFSFLWSVSLIICLSNGKPKTKVHSSLSLLCLHNIP